ncbi:MAG TPA: carboxypeptidase-like regulatory domain-containing protein [Thermoanaerobaculia bacterium]|nr:carboxypeptidase-like regulatory domain-containing protein [Thermoanaerobaculia bacterium]
MRKSLLLLVLALVALPLIAGAPLKGVDVKLGKNPGGSPAARTQTTDAGGHFEFPPVAKGSYLITVEMPANATAKAKKPKEVEVEVNGKRTKVNLQDAMARTSGHAVEVISDGKTAIRGTVSE